MGLSELLIPIVILSVIFPTHIAYAGNNEDPVVVNVGIDIQGLMDAITQSSQNLGNRLSASAGQAAGDVGSTITQVPQKMLETVKESAKESVRSFSHPLLGLAAFLLSQNPSAESMLPLWEKIIPVLSALYLLAFMCCAGVFFLSSLGSARRETAKEWLRNCIMIIITVNLSFAIYTSLLGLGAGVSSGMISQIPPGLLEGNILSTQGILMLGIYSLSAGMLVFTLFLRYCFLILGSMLFPVAFFLYFLPPLRSWGVMIFNLVGIALFMQFLDALLLVAAGQAMADLGPVGGALVAPLAFSLVAALNAFMFFFAGINSALKDSTGKHIAQSGFESVQLHLSHLTETLKAIPESMKAAADK